VTERLTTKPTKCSWRAGLDPDGSSTASELAQQVVVLSMRADPEPIDVVVFPDSHYPIVQPDTGREDRTVGVDLAKPQAPMMRVLLNQA